MLLSGGSPIQFCRCDCCKQCCHKFCGDEYVVNALTEGGDLVLAIGGDNTWKIQTGTSTIELSSDKNYPFCGVMFRFKVTAYNANLGTECVDIDGRMWLCNADHRDEGMLSCFCNCHWHVEVDECDGGQDFCENDCTFTWDNNEAVWNKTTACLGNCNCPEPDFDGSVEGETTNTFCSVNEFPEMNFIGGDGCLNAACDAPNCGNCYNLDNAAAAVVDPDYSVTCCCLDAYDVGEV